MASILTIDNDSLFTDLHSSLNKVGIGVKQCPCVLSALELVQQEPYDIIICADPLPVLDGLDLLHLKKTFPAMAETAIMLISSNPDRKLPLFQAGCDDFVLAPFHDSEILFRISSILKRRSPQGVHGTFADIAFLDFIQMLVSARRSGELQISFRDFSGVLGFADGQLFYAEANSAFGEDAFLEILRHAQREGSFVFSGVAPDNRPTNIHKRTDHLLLGLANVLDEEG